MRTYSGPSACRKADRCMIIRCYHGSANSPVSLRHVEDTPQGARMGLLALGRSLVGRHSGHDTFRPRHSACRQRAVGPRKLHGLCVDGCGCCGRGCDRRHPTQVDTNKSGAQPLGDGRNACFLYFLRLIASSKWHGARESNSNFRGQSPAAFPLAEPRINTKTPARFFRLTGVRKLQSGCCPYVATPPSLILSVPWLAYINDHVASL